MNRTLRRPMFRMGGSAEGLTSGLAPRQGYAHEPGHVKQSDTSKMKVSDLGNMNIGQLRELSKSMAYKPRGASMSDFLINFGLDIASRPASGSIFSTAAEAAKNPFSRFQKSKQMEQAYGMSETSEDRALIASLIKGMDEDKLSALMKDVKAGVEAGEFATEAEGIKLLLQKKIYGVLDMPGEAENARIRELELMISRDQEVPAGAIRAVAEHIYKIETGAYPEDIQTDLNRTKTYIKPNHISSTVKDAEGNITEILLDGRYAKSYVRGQIYFDPGTGELFSNQGKEGEAPRFVLVVPDKK